jgi:hypothetical protein
MFIPVVLLRDCDDGGRQCGAEVCTIDEALQFIRALAQECSLSIPLFKRRG